MAKKETTKPKKESELDDSIPLRVSHGDRADIVEMTSLNHLEEEEFLWKKNSRY